MRNWLVAVVVLVGACGKGDDQGYCIGKYSESFPDWGVTAYEGSGCLWADKQTCDDAGGSWIDYVDTEFDGTGEQGIDGYCAAEGFPVVCTSQQLFLAEGATCPGEE